MKARVLARGRLLGRQLAQVVRAVLLVLIVLLPLVIAFTAGVLYAVGVRIVVAVREGFTEGQRLING